MHPFKIRYALQLPQPTWSFADLNMVASPGWSRLPSVCAFSPWSRPLVWGLEKEICSFWWWSPRTLAPVVVPVNSVWCVGFYIGIFFFFASGFGCHSVLLLFFLDPPSFLLSGAESLFTAEGLGCSLPFFFQFAYYLFLFWTLFLASGWFQVCFIFVFLCLQDTSLDFLSFCFWDSLLVLAFGNDMSWKDYFLVESVCCSLSFCPVLF